MMVIMNKQFFAIVVIIIAALVGIFAITKGGDDNNNGAGTATAEASSHIAGKADSKVNLTEYGDFQCPACKSYFPLVQQLKSEYGDRVAFQFRHYPLTQIHPNAFIGSRAAEAAGKQGKFFEMHDLLYENQDAWSAGSSPTQLLEGYAQQIGLNMDQFKADMSSSAVAAIINADVKQAQAIGSTSTPTFVINGKRIEKNPQSIDDFKKLLDEALANNQ